MIAVINKIKIFLSAKYASVAIIALAVVVRIIQLTFFYNIHVDRMYQVMAMQNFTEGHGISTAKVLPADLSAILYAPLLKWPPGHSLLLSPFYLLFSRNYIAADLTFDILTAIALIFICRRILRVLDTPLYLVNLFTLFTSFFIYSFFFINTSDPSAITFFLIAVYLSILIIRKKTFSLKLTLAATLCLFLCGLIKYLFISVVFIIPAFLFLKGQADKNKSIIKTALISFILLLVSLSALLVWQKISGGAAVYISDPTRGFFPEHLLGAHPAIPASFINLDTISSVLPASSPIPTIIFRIMQCLHLLLLAAAFIYVLRKIVKSGFKKITVTDSFFYLSFFLSAGITLVLVILSLRVGKEENIPGHWWTYVEESRYYGLVSVLVHLGVFLLYQYYRLRGTRFLKYLFICLLLLLLPETFRGIWFTARRLININREEYNWQYEETIQKYGGAMIRKERKAGEIAVVTGSSYYFYYRVGIFNHVPVLEEVNSINHLSKLKTNKPTLLLVILKEKDFPFYESFLANPKKELAGYFRGFYFYTVHVKPY